MTLLTPGYWQSTYWPSNYWQEDYWPEYSVFVPPVAEPSEFLGGMVGRRLAKNLLITVDGQVLFDFKSVIISLDGQVFLNFNGVYVSLDKQFLVNLNKNKPVYMIIN